MMVKSGVVTKMKLTFLINCTHSASSKCISLYVDACLQGQRQGRGASRTKISLRMNFPQMLELVGIPT